MARSVTLSFNIFDQGRKFGGNNRQYDVQNVKNVLESAATKERIAMREAYGYYGHGRRQLAGKMNLGEVETIQTPQGPIIIENMPCCVTTKIGIDSDGTVTHTQEVLDNNPGKAVQALLDSKVGGFSWAAGGDDGGRLSPTKMKSYYGMDYVLEPNYAKNRAFDVGIFESISDDEEQAILEAMISTGMEPAMAQAYASTFFNPYLMASELSREKELAELELSELESAICALKTANEALQEQIQREHYERGMRDSERREAIQTWASKSCFVMPNSILESLSSGDIEAGLSFFESVARGKSKLQTLPIRGVNHDSLIIPAHYNAENPEYGSVESAPDFD